MNYTYPFSKKYPLTQSFGRTDFVKKHPEIYGVNGIHEGVDYGAPEGTNIRAGHAGTVYTIFDKTGYGSHIRIRYGFMGRYELLYAHMRSFRVKDKSKVAAGQVIGTVGKTGSALGAHLHLGIWDRLRGRWINPQLFTWS